MKFPKVYSLSHIADLINSKFIGSEDFPISGINEIHVVEKGDIVFVDHPKYYDKALNSKASVILINKIVDCPEGKALLISDDPFRDFNKITKYFNSFKSSNNQISPSSKIGANTIIQPNCFVGNNVTIGDNCIIHANVSIYDNTIIGNNVIINSGTVIGGEAFYYKKRETGYDQLFSAGRVIIEDDVHIGSNTTIDRGVTGDTTIGKGSKLDNLIQIGHDTFIGERCLIASQTAVAGCVIIENNVTIWGQVGISSGVTIGESVILLAKSGVSKSLKGHTTYYGVPVSEVRTAYKEMAMIKRLPELFEKIKKITK
jgi:UDP-3-O-[3-hydroxymyristoyl] glucosamine N-acyltransferase